MTTKDDMKLRKAFVEAEVSSGLSTARYLESESKAIVNTEHPAHKSRVISRRAFRKLSKRDKLLIADFEYTLGKFIKKRVKAYEKRKLVMV